MSMGPKIFSVQPTLQHADPDNGDACPLVHALGVQAGPAPLDTVCTGWLHQRASKNPRNRPCLR
eukprot:866788-Amphidinium_carterae.2